MKWPASILAAIVLFLSTQCMLTPKMAEACEARKAKSSCCSKMKTSCTKPKKKESKQQDCNDGINPFMACCGCIYTLPEKPQYQLAPLLPLVVKNGCPTANFISSYISSSWHPPESV